MCATISAIKYLFKYVYKGYDSIKLTLQQRPENVELVHDEIKQHVDGRYVSAPEGMWRLLENKMHDRSHAVVRLPVHLPDQQMIFIQQGNERQAVERAAQRETRLTDWFALNRTDENARNLFYNEIPYHYVFSKEDTKWKPRQRGNHKVVTRLYSVSPRDVKRFHLRILLLSVKGPQSFEDLRTVDGVVYNSFKEAAIRRNLVNNDGEWVRFLAEASLTHMPVQLRE